MPDFRDFASLKATLTYNVLNGFGSQFVNQVDGADGYAEGGSAVTTRLPWINNRKAMVSADNWLKDN